MKRVLVIIGWEFWQHLRTRRFWVTTLFIPLLFTTLVVMPSLYYHRTEVNLNQVIGCVSFDTTNYFCRILSERLHDEFSGDAAPRLLIESITPDTTESLRMDLVERRMLGHAFDSLSAAYTQIQERRRYLFSRTATGTRTKQLKESYDELISTREQLDLNLEAFKRMTTRLDTMIQHAALRKADSLLTQKRIAGYITIDASSFLDGVVDFYVKRPMNLAGLQPLEHALQVILVEKRMHKDGVQVDKIQEMLRPVVIREILAEGSGRFPFSLLSTYLAPLVVLVFLLTGLITATGFLSHSVIAEKFHKIIEFLYAAGSPGQILVGKTLGIWLLGLFQMAVWILLIVVLVGLNVLNPEQFLFLNWENVAWSIVYFSLGYLFFSTIYITICAMMNSTTAANRAVRWLHLLLIFPAVLSAYAIFSPNALLARFLSYFPFLTPSFMILRIPIDQPPAVDFYITITIMVLFIVLGFSIAGKVYRYGNLSHTDAPLFTRLLTLLQHR